MSDEQQPELDLATDGPSFYTDEALVKELQQIENGLADFEARVPMFRRRIAALREKLLPSQAG